MCYFEPLAAKQVSGAVARGRPNYGSKPISAETTAFRQTVVALETILEDRRALEGLAPIEWGVDVEHARFYDVKRNTLVAQFRIAITEARQPLQLFFDEAIASIRTKV